MTLIYLVSLSIVVYLLFSPNGIIKFIREYKSGKYHIPDKYKPYVAVFSIGLVSLVIILIIIGLITLIAPYITLPLVLGISFFIHILKKIQTEKEENKTKDLNND